MLDQYDSTNLSAVGTPVMTPSYLRDARRFLFFLLLHRHLLKPPHAPIRSMMRPFMRHWHGMLGLVSHSPPWYRARLREELRERRAALIGWQKLSETADVLFCVSRACYDGFPVRRIALFSTPTCRE